MSEHSMSGHIGRNRLQLLPEKNNKKQSAGSSRRLRRLCEGRRTKKIITAIQERKKITSGRKIKDRGGKRSSLKEGNEINTYIIYFMPVSFVNLNIYTSFVPIAGYLMF